VADSALALRSTGRESGWVVTKNAYAARHTRVKVKVVKPNDDGALGMSPTYDLSSKSGINGQKNWYRFYVYRSSHAGPYRLYVEWSKNGVADGRDATGELAINGVVYLRLRFDDANIHFEASLDGIAWTDAHAEAFALPGYTLDSKFYYELSAYNTPANGALTVDDFAITSPQSNTASKPGSENLAATPRPTAFALHNYPNPLLASAFNAAMQINFALPQEAEIQLAVFDLIGREVRELVAGTLAAGNHQAVWNGKNREGMALSSGVYFLRLQYRTGQTGAWSQLVQRVMIVK